MAKGLHPPDNNHTISKDLLEEEFGTELGNYNANKVVDLNIEAKSIEKEKQNKKELRKKNV